MENLSLIKKHQDQGMRIQKKRCLLIVNEHFDHDHNDNIDVLLQT